jgi:FAD-linked sulfhydryl oxidase
MPSHGAVANRRLLLYLLAAAGMLSLFMISFRKHSNTPPYSPLDYSKTPIHQVSVDKETLHGGAIMPKLGNETLKAELGRAAWKLFHTTMSRYPDKPTQDEKDALFAYVHLFARLYPW